METKNILKEEELIKYFDDILFGNRQHFLKESLDVLNENMTYYAYQKKDYNVVKKFYTKITFIISSLINLRDFDSALKYCHTLDQYISNTTVGLYNFYNFICTYIFLLNWSQDYHRLLFVVELVRGDFLIHNDIKERLKNENNESDNFRFYYLETLKRLVRIFSFTRGVANSIGLVEEAGNFFYCEKMVEGTVYLNLSSVTSLDRAIRYYDNVASPYRMTYGMMNEKLTFKSKLRSIVNGIFNKINYYTSGYGEKPQRVIYSIVLLILFFSSLYQVFNLTNSSNFFQNFLFSLCTFTSFGIYQSPEVTLIPHNNFFVSIIFTLEIMLGLIFNGIFIVTLSRKIMR